MRRAKICVLSAFAALMLTAIGTAASGQIITDVKTAPMQASDTTGVPIPFHLTQPHNPKVGWVGARMRVHILDAGEVDIDGIVGIAGGGTRSEFV